MLVIRAVQKHKALAPSSCKSRAMHHLAPQIAPSQHKKENRSVAAGFELNLVACHFRVTNRWAVGPGRTQASNERSRQT